MRPVYRPLENWLLRRADAIIATSRRYAQSSRTLHPWLGKVHVVPVGVSPPPQVPASRIEEVRRRQGNRRIVFALGRMTYYKGYEVLIEAARLLPEDTVVVVGGGGQLLDHYRGLVQAAGLGDRIQFVGPMSTANVEAHFAAAELFCLASTVRAEAFGVVVLEAMARGLAVVAPEIPGSGLNWLHMDGVTGVTVRAGDPPALAAGIQHLLSDPKARKRYAQAGRLRWADGLTSQDMADMTMAIYQSLLEVSESPICITDARVTQA
jgi:glycosyltransferase involved in cell wall biosynthesis